MSSHREQPAPIRTWTPRDGERERVVALIRRLSRTEAWILYCWINGCTVRETAAQVGIPRWWVSVVRRRILKRWRRIAEKGTRAREDGA